MKRFVLLWMVIFAAQALQASHVRPVAKPLDSIGIAFKNNSYFIVHKIEKGQTLFSLSKIYKATTQEILEANPGMLPAVRADQLVLIPLKSYTPPKGLVLLTLDDNGNIISPEKEATPPPAKQEEKKKETITEPVDPPVETTEQVIEEQPQKFDWKKHNADNDLVHTVKVGETLYRIATFYAVSVAEVKELNGLTDNTISTGQQLLIKKGKKTLKREEKEAKEREKEEKKREKEKKNAEKKPEPLKEVTPEPQPVVETNGEITETGQALVIEKNFPDADKNIALHPKAPVGTIILVTNPANKRTVYVRVVGKLESDDKNLLIMISPEAARKLGATPEEKLKLQLSYAQ